MRNISMIIVALAFMSAETLAGSGNPLFDQRGYLIAADTGLARLNAATGEISWRSLADTVLLSPVMAGNRILVGGQGGVYAVNYQSGNVDWTIAANEIAFTPTIDEFAAFFGEEEGLLTAIDLPDGNLLWQRQFPHWVYSPALIGTRLVTGGQTSALYALDSQTGRTLWQIDVGQQLVAGPVALPEGDILIMTFDGTVSRRSVKDGELRWQTDTGVAGNYPTVSKDRAFVAGYDGTVRAMALHSGEILWRTPVSDAISQIRFVAPGWLISGEPGGTIVVLDSCSGAAAARFRSDNGLIGVPVIEDDSIIAITAGFGRIAWPLPVTKVCEENGPANGG